MDYNYYARPELRVLGVSNTLEPLHTVSKPKVPVAYCTSYKCTRGMTGVEKVRKYVKVHVSTCPDCGSTLFFSTKPPKEDE